MTFLRAPFFFPSRQAGGSIVFATDEWFAAMAKWAREDWLECDLRTIFCARVRARPPDAPPLERLDDLPELPSELLTKLQQRKARKAKKS